MIFFLKMADLLVCQLFLTFYHKSRNPLVGYRPSIAWNVDVVTWVPQGCHNPSHEGATRTLVLVAPLYRPCEDIHVIYLILPGSRMENSQKGYFLSKNNKKDILRCLAGMAEKSRLGPLGP